MGPTEGAPVAGRRAAWLWWLRSGGWALLDQALFAGTHFAVNILLARWLSPADYGAFALAYSLFLFVAVFHTALLTEPMMVFGAGKFESNFGSYIGILLCGHGAITSVVALGIAGAALLLAGPESAGVSGTLLGLSLALPFMLLPWLLRRTFYVWRGPQVAAAGAGVYLLVVLAPLYAAFRLHVLSGLIAFLVLGLGGLVTGLGYLGALATRCTGATDAVPARVILSEHWAYGRWATAATLLIWVRGHIYYPVLAVSVGLEGVALLRALMNLVNPVLQAIHALSTVLLPRLARHHATGQPGRLREGLRRAAQLFLASAAIYFLALQAIGPMLFDWLYSGRYSASAGLLIVGGAVPFATSLTGIFGAGLRAVERPQPIFWSNVAASGVTLVFGLPLSHVAGVTGAVVGLALGSLAAAVAEAWFFLRLPDFARANAGAVRAES